MWMDNLLQWMSPHLETCGLVPHDFPGAGRGLKATRSIPAGSRLLRCGAPRCFTANSIVSHKVYNVLGELSPTAPLDCLVVFLMYEDSLGAKSAYAPYIASLPREFSNPLYFVLQRNWFETSFGSCDEDTEALLRFQRGEFFKSWRNITTTVAPKVEKMGDIFDKNRFLWAWFVVATRSLYIDQQHPALVPFVDLLNHSPHAKVRIEWNVDEDAFELFTDKSYKAGEQVFINYGAHDNKKLAVYYGFVCASNPLSEVKLNWERTVAACPRLSEDKIKFLKSYGALQPLVCSYGGFTFSSKLFLWVAFYDGGELWSLVEKAENMPSDPRVSRAVLGLLRSEINRFKNNDSPHKLNNIYSPFLTYLFRSISDEKLSILKANIKRLS